MTDYFQTYIHKRIVSFYCSYKGFKSVLESIEHVNNITYCFFQFPCCFLRVLILVFENLLSFFVNLNPLNYCSDYYIHEMNLMEVKLLYILLIVLVLRYLIFFQQIMVALKNPQGLDLFHVFEELWHPIRIAFL